MHKFLTNFIYIWFSFIFFITHRNISIRTMSLQYCMLEILFKLFSSSANFLDSDLLSIEDSRWLLTQLESHKYVQKGLVNGKLGIRVKEDWYILHELKLLKLIFWKSRDAWEMEATIKCLSNTQVLEVLEQWVNMLESSSWIY